MQYLSHILFFLAGCFNGCSETLSFHFKTSVFQNKNPRKWNPNINWMYMKNFLGIMRLDAYHLFKLGMLICLMFSVRLHQEIVWYIDLPLLWFGWFGGFESVWKLLARPYKDTPQEFL